MSERCVVIIGSHGFIGGYLCHRFSQAGWEVIGVDAINMYKPGAYQLWLRHYDLRQKNQLSKLLAFYRTDCVHHSEISRIIRKHKPRIVINLGGTSVADVCKQNSEEAVRTIYQLNSYVLEAVKDYGELDRYVFVSSSMTYGDFSVDRPDEDAVKKPKDPYGAIKLGAELLVESFSRQFGINYTIVRPSAVYGPLDSNMRVTGIFMRNAHLGKPLHVNDVHERLDFTYVEDTTEGLFLAATEANAENETFNITRGEGRTILELAQAIQKCIPGVQIETQGETEFMEGLIRPARGALNIDKAREKIGYSPRYSLEEGVAKYAQAWREIYGPPGSPLM